ncbi:hypothetical protein FB451DRAFT_1220766 [Mycena latifolia]|nr:hypothetical protein FB451DRAFT_1220766 [Mycena latifolia]
MVRPRDGTHIDLHVNCMNCGKHDTEAVFKDCSGCFLYSYCSEDCQKADWAKHEEECQSMQEARRKGDVLPMLPEDFAYLFQFAMALVNRHRAEIVRVWKEEQPARTPLVSFDFSEDPNGVMRVGAECLETLPGRTAETGMFVQELGTVIDATWYFSARWKEIMARPVHDEDALVCVYLPHGKYVMPKWMFIRIDEEYLEDEGTVLEKLIKTVEGGVEYGLSEPPVS